MKKIQLRTNQNLLMGKVELVYWTEISTWKARFFTVWQIEAEINPPALSPATPTFVFSSPPSQKINQLWHMRKSTVPNAVLLARMCRVTSHPSSSQMGNLCSGARRYSTDIQIVFVALENHRCHTDLSLYIKTYSASMLTMVWCVFRLFTVHPTHIFSTKKPPFYPSFLYLHHERTRPFYLYWHQSVYKSWLVYLNNRWIWGKTPSSILPVVRSMDTFLSSIFPRKVPMNFSLIFSCIASVRSRIASMVTSVGGGKPVLKNCV